MQEDIQDDEEFHEKASTETEFFIKKVTPTEIIHEQRAVGKVSDALVLLKCQEESKKELEQERLSYAEALRLEEQMNEEQRAQIAKDAEIARQWEEEEKKKAMDEAKTAKDYERLWKKSLVHQEERKETVNETVNEPAAKRRVSPRKNNKMKRQKRSAQGYVLCFGEIFNTLFEPDKDDENLEGSNVVQSATGDYWGGGCSGGEWGGSSGGVVVAVGWQRRWRRLG
ncbi:hypothetical protein Tco_0264548 [Tanacetum coccineum]